MNRLPRSLHLSLVAVGVVGVATLARSILLERWTTVVAALALMLGAVAALRARTWGLGLVLAVGLAFPGAAALGFAPAWFWLVGPIGAAPFALALRPMVRFDAAATALFGALAAGVGLASAFAWREAAYAIFYALHSCR